MPRDRAATAQASTAFDGARQPASDPHRQPVARRLRLEPLQSLAGRRFGGIAIDHDMRPPDRHPRRPTGRLGLRAGEGAIVQEHETAPRELGHDRGQRLLVGDELGAHVVHHADIAGKPAQEPRQIVERLLRRHRRQQGVRPGTDGGIAKRLHRQLEIDLVPIGAGPVDQPLQPLGVGRESQRHIARQLPDGPLGELAVEPHSAKDEGDFRPGAGEKLAVDRPRIDLPGFAAILGDPRQRTIGTALRDRPHRRRHQGQPVGADHHRLVRPSIGGISFFGAGRQVLEHDRTGRRLGRCHPRRRQDGAIAAIAAGGHHRIAAPRQRHPEHRRCRLGPWRKHQPQPGNCQQNGGETARSL